MSQIPSEKTVRLSVIIITKNESAHIADCLASVQFADERVVVDSGSTDDTVEIAEQFGARVIETDWPGFGPQKNRALDAATGDWVLSLDADERITPELRDEILAVLQKPTTDAYEISRRSWYCGKFIEHSGWSPDYVTRLFRRGTARFSDHLVHERVLADGKVGRLKSLMLHYSYQDFSQVLKKVDSYTTLSARQMYAKGKRSGIGKAVLHGVWSFIRTYFLRRGFLDGAHGFALAVSNAENSYYRYLKLWLLGQESRNPTE